MENILLCIHSQEKADYLSDTTKIILAAFGSLIIAIIVFYLNRENNVKIKEDNIRAEICGICEKLFTFHLIQETSYTHYLFYKKISQDSIETKSKLDINELKFSSQEQYKKSMDASIQVVLYKAEFIKYMSVLFITISQVEKNKLLPLIYDVRAAKPGEHYKYEGLRNYEEIKDKFDKIDSEIFNKAMNDIGNALMNVKHIINPVFYSNKKPIKS